MVTCADDALNPHESQARFYSILASFQLGELEKAEESIAALRSDAETASAFPQTHHLLGMILAKRGDFSSAAVEYRAFLEKAPNEPQAAQIRSQLGEWESLGVIPPEAADQP